MSEMEQHVIDSIKKRYGQNIDLSKEPALILEIIRIYSTDLERTEAASDEYVQVETGAVGGVGQANRTDLKNKKVESQGMHEAVVSGEITNTEIMKELIRIRKDLNTLLQSHK
ncbi:hypothetical protein [Algoriphagus terrigena]|uniref:hypothetical protein n=1 Tax=Algoriphagus terrigena TaxID=344884 RepID=UPI00047D3EEB|nr:hypothetical protein [Algoriphagus terrigena]